MKRMDFAPLVGICFVGMLVIGVGLWLPCWILGVFCE